MNIQVGGRLDINKQKMILCQDNVQFQDIQENIPRVNIPIPIQSNNRQQNKKSGNYNNNKYGLQKQYVCSKYNKCLNDRKIGQKQRQCNIFEIPQQLLETDQLQYAKCLQVYPQKGITYNLQQLHDFRNNKIQQIDHYIKQQLRSYSRKQKQLELEKRCSQMQKKQRLRELSKKTKNILQKQKSKRKLEQQKGIVKPQKPTWGHNIFNNDNTVDQHRDYKLNKQQKQSINIKNKQHCLKPVKERIKEYKKQQLQLRQQNQRKNSCKHKHSNHAKDLVEIQVQINNDAQQILRDKKLKQKQAQQKKRITEAKIRALQIQSKQSLKKFKKKPVDPTIQFVVDIPSSINQNKKKKNGQTKSNLLTKQVIAAKKQNKQQINSNLSKMKEYSEKIRESQKSKKTLKSQQPQNVLQTQKQRQSYQENNYIQQQQLRNNSRFFIWNVPVYSQDLQKLQQNYYPSTNNIIKPAKTSFKEQVRQYLQNKFQSEQKQHIQQQKQQHFKQLVQQKKLMYLQEFQEQNLINNQIKGNMQIYFDEDQIYKHMPVANFEIF